MATVHRFEDLRAWQRGRELVKGVYTLGKQGALARDYGLRDQMQRAAVSICSNIAEGFERDGRGEFVQFLSQAKGSCGELRSQLYHVLDLEYAEAETIAHLQATCAAVSAMLSRLMASLGTSRIKGIKYKTPPAET